jgi:hypothetical protein
MIQILKGFEELYDAQLLKHLDTFYPQFIDLILCESLEIRILLRKVLLKIGTLKQLYIPKPAATATALASTH